MALASRARPRAPRASRDDGTPTLWADAIGQVDRCADRRRRRRGHRRSISEPGSHAAAPAGGTGAGAQRAFDLMHRFLCAQYMMCARRRLLSLQPTGPPLRSQDSSLLGILRNVPAGSDEVGGQLLEEPSSGLVVLSQRAGDGVNGPIETARARSACRRSSRDRAGHGRGRGREGPWGLWKKSPETCDEKTLCTH